MIKFPTSLPAYADPSLEAALKNGIEQLDARLLPLQQGLTAGGYALYEPFSVMIISAAEEEGRLLVKAGIFYRGVIAGCSCADDPSPTDETSEYCEVMFEIDRVTGEGSVTLVSG
ncbi:MAG: hypothetical protein RRB22_08880 [Gammaproteobacteria bacterium]|nr:hypothetical protein [Gammaproteobacteria bacterium]